MQVVPWLDEVLVPRFERAVFRIGDGVPAEVVDLFNRTELPVRSVDERYRAASHLQVVMGGFEDWFSSARSHLGSVVGWLWIRPTVACSM